ncbi:tyrosine-protein phosphatase [Paraburkholderia sp. BCC1886]|uniref:tyrosine-protein phosphatase n=1 Tax=Paraburkholderia sp. BCC1886 TaxID=2562670 RepID=UPI001184160E|nr:tyrosine-protein phosphatase [Paraburkholderia sp. BCC1886]
MPVTVKHCSPYRRSASMNVRASEPVPPDARQGRGAPTSRRLFLKQSAGALLTAGFGSSLLSACGGDNLDTDQPQTPRMASVNNFRDIAGAAVGYPTVDGKQMRRGAFYRANTLTFDVADQCIVDKLSIATVYDLRTPSEVSRVADSLPAGAIVETINVLGMRDFVTPPFDAPGAANGFMESQARNYVLGAAQRASYGELLRSLAQGAGAQLVHSTAGKDRAGWVAALLLSIANVPLDVIMQDYLLSNVYLSPTIEAQTETMRAQDGDMIARAKAPLLGVQESYLQAGFDQVQASYGTMQSYLMHGLGVPQTTIDTLRARLVM